MYTLHIFAMKNEKTPYSGRLHAYIYTYSLLYLQYKLLEDSVIIITDTTILGILVYQVFTTSLIPIKAIFINVK
jgi:hypothetical protein